MSETIVLYGCTPEPLIHYLKAIGVLRLVAEQLDPQVRGAWRGDSFALQTSKTKEDIVAFFLNDYRPTPIVAPWNGGSGFYEGDDMTGVNGILATKEQRFSNYRETIKSILGWPEISQFRSLPLKEMKRQIVLAARRSQGKARKELLKTIRELRIYIAPFSSDAVNVKKLFDLTIEELENQLQDLNPQVVQAQGQKGQLKKNVLRSANKLRTKVKQLGRAGGKEELFKICRSRLEDQTVAWLDAAYVLGEEKPDFPPLLGSGGNDGRFDFTTNYMSRLLSVLPEFLNTQPDAQERITQSAAQLQASLLAEGTGQLEKAAVGQFHPAGAGGANAEQGVTGDSFVNPWDFIFALEGSLMLASATVRQLAAGSRMKASFPFTVRNSSIGYGTAISGEKVRAEIWLPLWYRLCSYSEVVHIFQEGRVQFSRQRRIARTGFDFARAVAELGVDRGIESFQRYAFIERNGQANLAAPLGRFEVRERPRAALIHEIDRWLDSFSRATSSDKVPPRFVRAQQSIEEPIFRLCESGSSDDLREVLVSLGRAEFELAGGEKFREDKNLRPLSGLSLSWVKECNDGSNEFKLALSLASIHGEGCAHTIRENIESVEVSKESVGWAPGSVHAAWSNGSLEDNLAAVLHRRSIQARSSSLPHPVLTSGRTVSLNAINAFLNRATDDDSWKNSCVD